MKYLLSKKIIIFYLLGIVLLLISILISLLVGPSNLNILKVFESLLFLNKNHPDFNIIWYVRIPRIIATLICGSALSVSGLVLQKILSNKLASPSTIGINSGALLAVSICSIIGFVESVYLFIFAFIGSLATSMIIVFTSKKYSTSKGSIILMGVAINSLLVAITQMISIFSEDIVILSNEFRIGSFSHIFNDAIIPSCIISIVCFILLLIFSNKIDILTLGDDIASGLGLNVNLTRIIIIIIISMLSGISVSICGLVSFVGLIVPHIIKKVIKTNTFNHIIFSIIYGAMFVLICDTISRCVFSPYEIPVGIILAFIGVPVFIIVLVNKKGDHAYD